MMALRRNVAVVALLLILGAVGCRPRAQGISLQQNPELWRFACRMQGPFGDVPLDTVGPGGWTAGALLADARNRWGRAQVQWSLHPERGPTSTTVRLEFGEPLRARTHGRVYCPHWPDEAPPIVLAIEVDVTVTDEHGLFATERGPVWIVAEQPDTRVAYLEGKLPLRPMGEVKRGLRQAATARGTPHLRFLAAPPSVGGLPEWRQEISLLSWRGRGDHFMLRSAYGCEVGTTCLEPAADPE